MGKRSLFDSFEAKGKRQILINSLRQKGIDNEEILEAMNRVPRHSFMENAFLNHAYQDKPFPIGAGQTISQPYTVAFQTMLLGVSRRSKVLEIGTGSGYQAAILAEMGVRVYTIERQRELFEKAQSLLGRMGYNIHFFFGDGYEGKPLYGPYDAILVTAAAPEVPPSLLEQLKTGGRLVVPVGKQNSQEMIRVVRKSGDDYETTRHGYFTFVPMLKGTANRNKKR